MGHGSTAERPYSEFTTALSIAFSTATSIASPLTLSGISKRLFEFHASWSYGLFLFCRITEFLPSVRVG